MVRVSIIIPARNASATIDATLQSVAGQTFQDWEAIIYDDLSTDCTADLVRSWCEREPRFRMIIGAEAARGVANARNGAAELATGSWLLFLDADDLIRQDHLSLALSAASREADAVMVYGTGARLTPDGRIGPRETPVHTEYFRHLAAYNPFYTHACLVRRATFEEFGGFDSSLHTCEDWDLWQRLARAGARFTKIDDCIALYRMRPDSLTHDADLVFKSACEVILRGHDKDPRVREPAPSHANGVPQQGIGPALLGIAIWCAGELIGSGKDAVPFLKKIELVPAHHFSIPDCVSVMQRGILNGACALQDDWPSLLSATRAMIHDAFSALKQRGTIQHSVSQCMEFLESYTENLPQRKLAKREPDESPTSTKPAIGEIRFGDFLRLQPVSTNWGIDRGTPIDRFYIESFLDRHREDIRGRVLEIEDNRYTRRFGGDRVDRSDILHVDPSEKSVTIVADLASADHIETSSFDCIILTQTLQMIFDVSAAVRTLERILKPGGVLLLTVPGITTADHGMWHGSWLWSFSSASVKALLKQWFPEPAISIESRGNVLAATAFLLGASQEDVPAVKFQVDDPNYPVTVLARAVKAKEDGRTISRTDAQHSSHAAEKFVRKIRNPDAASVMVVAAHPDDEVIGAGGHLRFWKDLSVVRVTNGAPRDPRYAREAGFPDPESYVAAREREAESAMSIIALPKERLIALSFVDRETMFHLADISRRLMQLFAQVRPEIVVTHPYEGGHPDHDSTCFCVHTACRLLQESNLPLPAIVEMSSYFGRDGVLVSSSFLSNWPVAETFKLDRESYQQKQQMFAHYASQKALLEPFLREVESFRPSPRYDFGVAPHAGRLFYEYDESGTDGALWRAMAEAAMFELGFWSPPAP